MSDPTFVEACLNGSAHVDEVDDWIQLWHDSTSSLSLEEFLGLSESEYSSFAEDPSTLAAIIDSHR